VVPLSHTRDEVSTLNTAIRDLRRQSGELGRSESISTATGKKPFAVHDRIRFGRNERDLGVKNGSLGIVERIERGVLQIKLDGPSGTRVAVDTKFYKHLDYGYATTVHKAQGTTVDRIYVLATPHFDRHTSYVELAPITRRRTNRSRGVRAPRMTWSCKPQRSTHSA
jgi:ATP-dependent exoDNAse (exonuclease V) alpha subunit